MAQGLSGSCCCDMKIGVLILPGSGDTTSVEKPTPRRIKKRPCNCLFPV